MDTSFYKKPSASKGDSADTNLATPTVLNIIPAVPSDDNSPLLFGSGPVGATIAVYTDSSCSTQVASGSVSNFSGLGITLSVGDNTTTTFYIKARLGGQISNCSSSSATYRELTPLVLDPQNLRVIHYTDVEIEIYWDQSISQTESDYRISYQLGPTPPDDCSLGTSIPEDSVDKISRKHTLLGLSANTEYSILVCSIDSVPNESTGISLTLTTHTTCGVLSDPGTLGFTMGDGSGGNPYQITNSAQLNNMRNFLSSSFMIMNDIDLFCDDFVPTGDSIIAFTGRFDGNHKIISNLMMTLSQDEAGFFGKTDGAIITKVHLENITINNTGPTDKTGGLAGRAHSTTITQSSVSGDILTDTTKGNNVGGVVGYIRFATSTINETYFIGNITGNDNVGGIVGVSNQTALTDCYSHGNITASSRAGNLVGSELATSSTTDCYATGDINRIGGIDIDFGGLIGTTAGTVTTSYRNTDATANLTLNTIGTPKTSSELKNQATFVGFIFTTIWTIDEGNAYPKLGWEFF